MWDVLRGRLLIHSSNLLKHKYLSQSKWRPQRERAEDVRFSVPPGYRRTAQVRRPKLDRLTHHVHILEMNGESFRLNQSRARNKRASR